MKRPSAAKAVSRIAPVRRCDPVDMVDVIGTVIMQFIIAYIG